MQIKPRKYKPYTKEENSIRTDGVFKIVFGSNERTELLKDFLESILEEKITNIAITNEVALNKIHKDNKGMKLDVIAEINEKDKIHVEMQNRNEYNIEERTYGYSSGLYFDSLKEGNSYSNYKKTVIIWI